MLALEGNRARDLQVSLLEAQLLITVVTLTIFMSFLVYGGRTPCQATWHVPNLPQLIGSLQGPPLGEAASSPHMGQSTLISRSREGH